MDMLDGNAAALRSHLNAEDQRETLGSILDALRGQQAVDLLSDPNLLRDLVIDFEANIWRELARALSNLDRACQERHAPMDKQHAVTAVLTSLSNMQRELIAVARAKVELDA